MTDQKQTTDMERISARLMSFRAERGWSLDETANRCGLSKSHVWSLERGSSCNPTIRMVRCLADGFGVPLAAFLDETYSPRLHPTAIAIAVQVDRAIKEARAHVR